MGHLPVCLLCCYACSSSIWHRACCGVRSQTVWKDSYHNRCQLSSLPTSSLCGYSAPIFPCRSCTRINYPCCRLLWSYRQLQQKPWIVRRRLLLYRLQSDNDNVINWTPVKYKRGQLVGGGEWRRGGGGAVTVMRYVLATDNCLSKL